MGNELHIRKQIKKAFLLAVKIAVGSSLAIYIAELLHLEYATSAGTITLLTLFTTKWQTVRLSIFRVITFVVSVQIVMITSEHIQSTWVAYGVFVLIVAFICEFLGWRSTISVNSVVGVHLLTSRDFSVESILNELVLVLIGISFALALNLFHDNVNRKKDIIANMRDTENRLQMIMGAMASYLMNRDMEINVWENLRKLEKDLSQFRDDAYEYQENTFQSHPGYYIDYFEMRKNQCMVLHSLHFEMKKIRTMPKQSKVVADYMLYLMDFVVELNEPSRQMERLTEILEDMELDVMPITREEFESRALLYHIVMDLEEFLKFKAKFVGCLDERQRKEYWNG